MAQTTANGIRLEYETLGDRGDPTVLLVMGLGEQLTAWHLEFCEELVDRGHHVVRFDNRDIGLSQKFEEGGIPDILTAMVTGQPPDAPYTLDDMAADAVGLLDALEIETAHVAGASMGGMIAQTIAINHPSRVRSLTSIMSTTGDPSLPQGEPNALRALISPIPGEVTEDAIVERGMEIWDTLAGSEFPIPREKREAWLRRDFQRSFYPFGVPRQLAAILAHGDRTAKLEALDLPAVVLHGAEDPLIPVACGEATAAAIPDADLRIIDGWGHDFPPQLIETLADAIESAVIRSG